MSTPHDYDYNRILTAEQISRIIKPSIDLDPSNQTTAAICTSPDVLFQITGPLNRADRVWYLGVWYVVILGCQFVSAVDIDMYPPEDRYPVELPGGLTVPAHSAWLGKTVRDVEEARTHLLDYLRDVVKPHLQRVLTQPSVGYVPEGGGIPGTTPPPSDVPSS